MDSYPLQWPADWPRTPVYSRKRAPYTMTLHKAMAELLRELKLMGSTDVVISSNLMLRKDGLPLADQREPSDPGIVVYWTTTEDGKKVQHVMPCDVWVTARMNLRAIGLNIEALRMMQRTGAGAIAKRAREAFAALPAGEPAKVPVAAPWHNVLGVPPNATLAFTKAAYRRLCVDHHPDHGGSSEKMAELNAAMQRAQEHFDGAS